jgi:hypothetical protein
MTKHWKKITAEKKLNFFGSKTTIFLSLGLHKERTSYRRSLQLSKEAIQHFKTWTFKKISYFCGSFLPSWIWIKIPNPDPDPLTRLNPDPIRIRNPALNTTYHAGRSSCRTRSLPSQSSHTHSASTPTRCDTWSSRGAPAQWCPARDQGPRGNRRLRHLLQVSCARVRSPRRRRHGCRCGAVQEPAAAAGQHSPQSHCWSRSHCSPVSDPVLVT